MVEDIDNAEKRMCRHIIWEILYFPLNFAMNLKLL